MRIESFWAKGFRSLRDVQLRNLGPFNVFYGPNGSGKSNLLAAKEAWLRLIPIALEHGGMIPLDAQSLPHQQAIERRRGTLALHEQGAPIQAHDFALGLERRRMTLGGTLVGLSPEIARAKISFHLDATVLQKPTLHWDEIEIEGLSLDHDLQATPAQDVKLAALENAALDIDRKFSAVPADRMPRIESAGQRPPDGVEPLSWYFRRGQLKDALFAAQNTTSPATLRALQRFRELMQGAPLHRPAFRSVEDPHTGIRDLREWLPPPLDGQDISLDLAGLGIAQIYWILAQAMLSGADIIAVEEPEAHLHAPSTGRMLRQLLQRLVHEEHIDQLFIATHSNLFDLDDTGFFDVRLENGETLVQKKPLDAIDQHLYEPGPTLHAFEELLRLSEPERVMFRRADGAPVSAREMVSMLRAADPVALEYLQDLHRAAVDVVGLRARRKAGS
jgi:hypothetical protein